MSLAVASGYKKIWEIDNHIALVSAGSLADARNLADMARIKAQINRITYGEPISVATLTKYISDRKHLVTQYAGVRPYGVGLLIGGVEDTNAKLFETEPSGTMIEWKAQAIGRGADKARRVLEKGYKESLDEKTAIKLLLKAMKAGEKTVSPQNVDIVAVKKNNVRKLSDDELAKLI